MKRRNLESELIDLLDQGIIFDRSEKPLRPTVAIVGTQRSDRLDVVEDFVHQLQQTYPQARIVVGDGSTVEKEAVRAATMLGLDYEIVEKAGKDEWNAGSQCRDERVVAKATHVVLMDSSARSLNYKRLAELQMKHVSVID